jgi:hypothetical protein
VDVKQNSDKNKNELPIIDCEKAIYGEVDKSSFDKFLEPIKYIPLETNKECLISKINNIIYYKDCFYVVNYSVLLKFNSQGKFICQIGKKGKGPKEYLQLRDVSIQSDTIYINGRNKILVFNLDGKYISEFAFPDALDFEKLHDSFVFFNSGTGKVIFTDLKGQITKSIVYEKTEGEKQSLTLNYNHHHTFFQSPSMCCINTGYTDTIQELDSSNRLIPKYVINLGKFKLPAENRVEFVGFDKFDKLSAPFIRPVLIDSNNLLFIQFNRWFERCDIKTLGLTDNLTGAIGLGVYDKNNSRFYNLSDEDKDKTFPCFYPYFSDGKDHLISYVSAYDALNYFEKNKSNPVLFKPFVALTHQLNETDNPVIMVTKIKGDKDERE